MVSATEGVASLTVARRDHGTGFTVWVRLLRPRQWIKNIFILAPLLFSGRALDGGAQLRAAAAFAVFCLLASGVYAFNDVIDRESDRAHPLKRSRPVAAGAIPVSGAMVTALALVCVSVALAFAVAPGVGAIAVAYLAINVLYGLVLKRVVIVDVFAIASFFVLRLLAGAAAVRVQPSVWLLLCGGLLALYLGFAKRRHELVLLGDGSSDHRAVLSQYTTGFLDQLSVVLLAVTIVSYIMYTVESPTSQAVGSQALSYSTVFVLYGVFRYLYLVHRHEGGNPAETLLTDRSLLAAGVLWVVYCAVVIYRPFS
ncbi:MAG: Decaprenyl-phosphate phosphoribosyltransferase [Gemmatimonadaceae bacterium]|nr:Decaprenyl-phosphate phosphoribosyltransferase [Gemmatimonadaceae bacterium]